MIATNGREFAPGLGNQSPRIYKCEMEVHDTSGSQCTAADNKLYSEGDEGDERADSHDIPEEFTVKEGPHRC